MTQTRIDKNKKEKKNSCLFNRDFRQCLIIVAIYIYMMDFQPFLTEQPHR
uniref:Uncharacterized protein n=1 Tax=Octopus bimaculoides TaxID=37653 RepID=A0A0L8GG81_OCTBM